MLKRLTYIILTVLLLTACTADVSDRGGTGVMRFSLSARTVNTGDYTNGELECERIRWYRVIITSASDRRVIYSIDKKLDESVVLDELEELILTAGTYHVYAFANIDTTYLSSLGLTEGGMVPENINTIRYTIPGYFNATEDPTTQQLQGDLVEVSQFAAAGHYVPMTGLAPQVIEVSQRVTQTYNIEVRRLFAKMEFAFRNATSEDLQINSIAVSDMTTNISGGSVLLMNYEENRQSIDLPYVLKDATLSHPFASPLAVYAAGETVRRSFYVLESRASRITNSFDLRFGITRLGESESGVATDDMRYALTDPATLTLIHRNDWITIPVTLGDWQMRLEARSYPPIGGYAEAELDQQSSDEFVVAFVGGGDFVIRPFIRKAYDGSDWFGIDDKTKVVGTPEIEVQDGPSKLFINDPELTASGEILGKMAIFPGRSACITIRVRVIEGTTPLLTTKTLTRKIYVTQK